MRPSILRLPRQISRRNLSATARLSQSPFVGGPAPPRLPKEEQEIFERLQRQSTGAFSTPREEVSTSSGPSSSESQNPRSSSIHISQSPASSSSSAEPEMRFENGKDIKKGEDVHPNMRRGAAPEFEGDVNPKTGEVGGPKNEPLRWGVKGDWSYNGRVTDF